MKTRLQSLLALLGTLLLLAVGVPRGALGAAGDLDAAYNPNPGSYVFCGALQPDGKLVIGGDFGNIGATARSRIARLDANGVVDAAFNPGANNYVRSLVVQADGKIIVGGAFTTIAGGARNMIARLNADGTLDTTFNPNITGAGTISDGVIAMATQPDGKIVVGGVFTAVGGVTRNYVARLNADGTLDAAFNPNANSWVTCMSLRSDGKIFIGGLFTSVGASSGGSLALLNADGTVSSLYGVNSDVWSLAAQADGKIVFGGSFSAVGSFTRHRLARLNADGSMDTLFNPDVTLPNYTSTSVDDILIQTNGAMVICGSFTTVGGVTHKSLARLNPDGTLDAVFNPILGNDIGGGILQNDGRIVILSPVGSVGGVTRNWIARLLNDPTTESLAATAVSRVQWLRGGASPEAAAVTFELSTDGGGTWTALGAGTRVTGGWEKTGLSLPASGTIRARAQTRCGSHNASSGLVEKVAAFDVPPVLSPVTMASNNANPALAKTGDVITVSFTSNEAIQTPVVTLAGRAATVANAGGNNWTGAITVAAGDSQGAVALSIVFQDLAGTSGTTVTAVTSGGAVSIDTVAPGTPSPPDLASASDTGASNTDNITKTTTPTFIGTATTGATVTLYDTNGTTVLGTATATSGSWSIVSTTLGAGNHTITAKASDAAGNLSAASSGLTVTIDTAAPILSPVTVASNNGVGGATRARAGDSITLSFTSNETIQTPGVSIAGHPATVNGAGTSWTASITVAAGDPQGAVVFGITATDPAGNVAARSTTTDGSVVTVDTIAPAKPAALALAGTSDSGISDTDRITKFTELTITGSAEAGALVKLFSSVNGQIGSATATGGSWTITTPTLGANVTHSLTATATDAAGNTGLSSTALTVTIDTIAPTLPTASLASTNANPAAAAAGDNVVVNFTSSETIPTPSVTLLGRSATVSGAGTNWSASVKVASNDPQGVGAFGIAATDAAGNAVTRSTTTNGSSVTVDTIAPVVAAHANVTVEATSAAGAVVTYAAGSATDAGTASPTITYSKNSGTTFPIGATTVTISATDAANNTGTGTFTVTVQDTTAPVVTPPANMTVHAGSPFGATVSYPLPQVAEATGEYVLGFSPPMNSTLPAGTTTVTVTATDLGNNVGTATFTVTVTPLTSLESWRYAKFGTTDNTGNSADAADSYGKGIQNLAVFALLGPNQDPQTADLTQLPQVQMSGGNLFCSFTQPTGVSGVTYGAEWRADLSSGTWTTLADTGTGTTHTFSVPIAGNPQIFMRLKVTSP